MPCYVMNIVHKFKLGDPLIVIAFYPAVTVAVSCFCVFMIKLNSLTVLCLNNFPLSPARCDFNRIFAVGKNVVISDAVFIDSFFLFNKTSDESETMAARSVAFFQCIFKTVEMTESFFR